MHNRLMMIPDFQLDVCFARYNDQQRSEEIYSILFFYDRVLIDKTGCVLFVLNGKTPNSSKLILKAMSQACRKEMLAREEEMA